MKRAKYQAIIHFITYSKAKGNAILDQTRKEALLITGHRLNNQAYWHLGGHHTCKNNEDSYTQFRLTDIQPLQGYLQGAVKVEVNNPARPQLVSEVAGVA